MTHPRTDPTPTTGHTLAYLVAAGSLTGQWCGQVKHGKAAVQALVCQSIRHDGRPVVIYDPAGEDDALPPSRAVVGSIGSGRRQGSWLR